MQYRLVTALSASTLSPTGAVPSEIVYIPEGQSKINPFVDGKPKQITVNVPPDRGPAIAATLQADLDTRHSGNVRPWFDFEHKGGASSALPQSFRYEPGKGVMCAVEWTGAGRSAVENKDFGYFSPAFLIDDNGMPAGLPSRGACGSLVNEPAFREMPRIAASDASTAAGDEVDTETGAGSKDGASDAPADEATKTKFRDMAKAKGLGDHPNESEAMCALCEADPAFYDSISMADPEAADDQGKADDANDELDAKAKSLVASGDAANYDAGIMMAIDANPALYNRTTAAGVRRETLAEIDKIKEVKKPEPKEQLDDLAKGFKDSGAAKNDDEAMCMAFDKRPDLYQAMQDYAKDALNPSGTLEERAKGMVAAGHAASMDEAIGHVAAADPGAYLDYLKTLH